MSVKIFICYAHEEKALLNQLIRHLKPLQREGLIDVWHDRDINAGTLWEREINEQLNEAQIILLLISPSFIHSDYCYSIEMKRALERNNAGEARVIPIILRPIYLKGTPFEQFQVLPSNAKPVTRWQNRDDALLDVAKGIGAAVEEFLVPSPPGSSSRDAKQMHAKYEPPSPSQPSPNSPPLQDQSGSDPASNPERRKYQNLSSRVGLFLGRKHDKNRVLQGLASKWPLIPIEGIGGVGKSTLALQVAYDCLDNPEQLLQDPFDAVVWVSAKVRSGEEEWLNEVIDQIAFVLEYPAFAVSPNKQSKIRQLLQTYRTLVVVDNFETIENPVSLINWLRQIPEPSKVLITSRLAQLRGSQDQPWVVHLKGLSEDEALQLIRNHVQRLELAKSQVDNEDDLRGLIRITEGNPQAIVMALGYLEIMEFKLKVIINDLQTAGQSVEAIFDYLYQKEWEVLESYPDAQHLLFAITFFVDPVNEKALKAAAGTHESRFSQSAQQLKIMSLLEDTEQSKGNLSHYSIHPLTRAFVGRRLSEVSQWQQEARERWVQWYLNFTRENGGLDWIIQTPQYDAIEGEWGNLLAVLKWCTAHKRYDDLKAFWSKDRLRSFADRNGHWPERLFYFDWIINEAREREDWLICIDAMEAKSWTLISMGQLEALQEADKILAQAYKLCDFISADDATKLRYHLANDMTMRELRRHPKNAEVVRCLKVQEDLLKQIKDKRMHGRFFGYFLYNKGAAYQIVEQYEEAKDCFQKCLSISKDVGWERGIMYAKIFLAEISIKLGNLDEALSSLEESWQLVQNTKDKRHIAYYKRAFAYLEQAQYNTQAAHHWAMNALDDFQHLDMEPEVEEMRKFDGD